MSEEVKRFEDFVLGLGLKFFKPYEFLIQVDRPFNSMPPERLWPNIVPIARVLDEVRRYFGRPTLITSCYRTDEYNLQVGGVPKSTHREFKAADFVVSGVSAVAVAKYVRMLRTGNWFKGGIGVYSTFTHVDNRGKNVRWWGR